ncbi:ABC transporter substrate-binding protein [Roseivivax sp. GX 12232]|uniref:ABC transporter substrate-binding protein n=1 Tax=Roseivivax sp. GX 12232 TaxID=2900547 RepID=UPI001E3BCBB6|nr:ABC transporter substrate-binding protein [Roseivivax sp. GX 12232]MCE0506619.1 ABC transporter substrate-binding protein [Roseivivax sp. GX 12232]
MTAPRHKTRVIAFPGAPNLPIFAALEEGFFAERDLAVEIELTPSSIYQAEEVAAGTFDVAMTAFDNVVAYSTGQGAAGPGVDPAYVAVMGATQLELSFVTAPEITRFEDLRGRSIALDAKDTGFAFVLSEMLERAGLAPGETDYVAVGATPQRWQSVQAGTHVGTLTIEPFTTLATRAGFQVLQKSTDILPAYQGGVMAANRGYREAQPEALSAYMRGYLAGLDWVRRPKNREAAAAHLQKHMPAIKPQAVAPVMASLLDPRSGLTPEGAILPEGMACVLDLRSRHGSGGALSEDIAPYIDLSLWEEIRKGAPA